MTRKIVGLFQLITGIFGSVIMVTNLFSNTNAGAAIYQIVAGTVLYAFVGWAGYGLINKKKNALNYSKILQALQVVSFTLSGFMYKFSAAAFVVFGLRNGKFSYAVSARVVDFTLGPVGGNDTVIVVYLIPLVLLLLLLKVK